MHLTQHICKLPSVMTAMVGRRGFPVHGCNDADELGVLIHVVGSAPRRKDAVSQVTDVVQQGLRNAFTYSHVFLWANDVVCEEQNLREIEVILLQPRTVPDWHASRACGSKCDSPTSPWVTVLKISVDAPGHLGSALTAQRTASN